MGMNNILGLAINPHKSPFRSMGNYKSPFPINPPSPVICNVFLILFLVPVINMNSFAN